MQPLRKSQDLRDAYNMSRVVNLHSSVTTTLPRKHRKGGVSACLTGVIWLLYPSHSTRSMEADVPERGVTSGMCSEPLLVEIGARFADIVFLSDKIRAREIRFSVKIEVSDRHCKRRYEYRNRRTPRRINIIA